MSRLIVIMLCFLAVASLRLQSQCNVNLGADTSICTAAFTIHPTLSVSTFEDSLEIIYDATQGQTGLVGAAKVYMHSAAEMVPFGGWQNIVGNWGLDDGIGQMTNIGTDLWRIRIVPHLYYGYAASVSPNGLFMVFRNAAGTATGKDANGNDIWADMTQSVPVSAFGGVQFAWIMDALDSLHWSDGSNGESLTVNSSGTYWVTMTDTAGCIATDSIVVTLGTLPLIDLGQPAICDGTPAILDAGAGFAQYNWSTGAITQTISVSSPGLIVVTVTNAAGCTGIDVVNVPLSGVPTASFVANVNGLTVQLVDGSTYGETYQWDFDNNGSIDATTPGTTSHTYPSAGTYTIRLIVSNYCGADTSLQTVTLGGVGIEDGFADQFAVFPNPASDMVTVVLPNSGGNSLEWILIDASGRICRSGGGNGIGGVFKKNIEIQGLPSGIYRLVLRDGDQSRARSFLKL